MDVLRPIKMAERGEMVNIIIDSFTAGVVPTKVSNDIINYIILYGHRWGIKWPLLPKKCCSVVSMTFPLPPILYDIWTVKRLAMGRE